MVFTSGYLFFPRPDAVFFCAFFYIELYNSDVFHGNVDEYLTYSGILPIVEGINKKYIASVFKYRDQPVITVSFCYSLYR